MYQNKKVLVTGAAGFIGSNLCKKLIDNGADVHAFGLRFHDKIKGINYHEGDITYGLPEIKGIDVIFHLAAQPSVYVSQKDPLMDFRVNAFGTVNVLEFARKSGSKIVFSSSISLHQGSKDCKPQTEDMINLQSFYSLSKSTAENYIRFYQKMFQVRYTICRFSFVYGPGLTRGPIYDIFSQIRKGKKIINMFTNIYNKFDFIFIDDLTRALLKIGISEKSDSCTLNISTSKEVLVTDIAKTIARLYHIKDIKLVDMTNKDFNPKDSICLLLDNSRLRGIIDWKDKVSIEMGIKQIFNSFKKGD